MIFNVWDYTVEGPDKEITMRCPGCGNLGTFDALQGVPDGVLPRQRRWPSVYLGQRRCPNKTCNTHLFFALQRDRLLAVYPPERLDFDKVGRATIGAVTGGWWCDASIGGRVISSGIFKLYEDL